MTDSKDPTLSFEIPLWQRDVIYIAGIDEAGRGALAGPVMAGAVILPADPDLCEKLKGVRDSKLMTPRKREEMAGLIRSSAVSWAVGEASEQEIDEMNILNATKTAMRRAIAALSPVPQHLLIDYVHLEKSPIPQTSIKFGDRLSLSIACASILAKVTRDHRMTDEYALRYPEYGFEKHKGYGTASHLAAIAAHGLSTAHRQTFRIKSESSEQMPLPFG